MAEDIDMTALGLALVDIVQIAAIWVAEMAAQPDGFVIGEEELAEAIVEAEALVVVAKVANDELNEDDEHIEGDDDLMDDNEEMVADLLEKMIFGSDDDVPPYESD